MYHLHEVFVYITSHTHTGRVLISMFRMFFFQILKFTHQLVKLLVCNLRRIQYIIIIVMSMKLLAQLVYSFYFCHIYKGSFPAKIAIF